MAIVETTQANGEAVDLTEVNLTKSGLLILITDTAGHQVLISRFAWPGIVSAVEGLFEQEKRESQKWLAEHPD